MSCAKIYLQVAFLHMAEATLRAMMRSCPTQKNLEKDRSGSASVRAIVYIGTMPGMTQGFQVLLSSVPRVGRVEWIGVRPARRERVVVVEGVEAREGSGLMGDRFNGGASSKRQVTLIQSEHLPVIAQLLGKERIDPALLRRNIVVSGINLLSLNGAQFQIGGVLMEGTGPCHPCSRMEETFGAGGHSAVRGHGGITARVLSGGVIRIGEAVSFIRRSDGASEKQSELAL